jgi:hypothetical protein
MAEHVSGVSVTWNISFGKLAATNNILICCHITGWPNTLTSCWCLETGWHKEVQFKSYLFTAGGRERPDLHQKALAWKVSLSPRLIVLLRRHQPIWWYAAIYYERLLSLSALALIKPMKDSVHCYGFHTRGSQPAALWCVCSARVLILKYAYCVSLYD